ncbi:protein naked cuticle homolog 2-like [Lineus longissimus]|uniref:protein naked cuticle homolog 2-like n=1 Tax=Lineus longissimus TaxID=88925 RepID=UPI002B4E3427
MGKMQSKHVYHRAREAPEGECLLVNANMTGSRSPTPTGKEHIWKQQNATGFNLANYQNYRSELSICLTDSDGKLEKQALKVVLPPQKYNNKVLSIEEEDADITKTQIESETDNNKQETDGLNVEEFECGVSVEGSEKQEWSFTLYDFDGRGKITKEDLASLMRSLYDAVGSSIRLPTGTKTLRLRLTVAPDTTKMESMTETSIKLNNLSPVEDSAKKKRLSAAEHKQITDIMERHRSNLRRHCSDNRGTSEDPPRHRHHRRKNHDTATAPPVVQESQDRRNYYLDLAGIENNNTEMQSATAPSAILNSHGEKPDTNKTRHHKEKHRSRSYDTGTGQQDRNMPTEHYMKILEESQEHGRSRSHDPQLADPARSRTQKTAATPKVPKLRPVSLPPHVHEMSSPHHSRRHRHREKDRTMAMAQVAEWLEREDLWGAKDALSTTCVNESVIVQRHEHHHVHEHHHHHHYHHYHET